MKDMRDAPRDGRWIIGDFGEYFGLCQMRWSKGDGPYVEHWAIFGKWTPGIEPSSWVEMPKKGGGAQKAI